MAKSDEQRRQETIGSAMVFAALALVAWMAGSLGWALFLAACCVGCLLSVRMGAY